MAKSSLTTLTQTDGMVEFGRLSAFNAFEVLGSKSEFYGRISQIGNSPVGGLMSETQIIPDDYSTTDMNLNLQTNGNWVIDQNLKLMKVRMTAFGGTPFINKDDKLCIATDKECTNINAQVKNGIIFPNTIDSDTIGFLGNRQNGDVLAGIYLNPSTGQEWFDKFFQGFSSGGQEYVKLLGAGLLHAEVVFENGPSSARRFVMKVVQGPVYSENDKFRCGITAISCGDPNMQKVGIALKCQGYGQLYKDNKTTLPENYTYNFKNGQVMGLNLKKLAALVDSKPIEASLSYEYTQAHAYVRLFILPENQSKATTLLGVPIPEDLTKTNGIKVITVTKDVAAPNSVDDGTIATRIINAAIKVAHFIGVNRYRYGAGGRAICDAKTASDTHKVKANGKEVDKMNVISSGFSTDCSGYVWWVLAEAGLCKSKEMHSTYEMKRSLSDSWLNEGYVFKKIEKGKQQRGDIGLVNSSSGHHTGIVDTPTTNYGFGSARYLISDKPRTQQEIDAVKQSVPGFKGWELPNKIDGRYEYFLRLERKGQSNGQVQSS